MSSQRIARMFSRRRWGRGRALQLARRAMCNLFGHAYTEWHYDWPYDCWDEEMMEGPVRDPRPDELLSWFRGCEHDCGCIEVTHATLLQRAALPGRSVGMTENIVRQSWAG